MSAPHLSPHTFLSLTGSSGSLRVGDMVQVVKGTKCVKGKHCTPYVGKIKRVVADGYWVSPVVGKASPAFCPSCTVSLFNARAEYLSGERRRSRDLTYAEKNAMRKTMFVEMQADISSMQEECDALREANDRLADSKDRAWNAKVERLQRLHEGEVLVLKQRIQELEGELDRAYKLVVVRELCREKRRREFCPKSWTQRRSESWRRRRQKRCTRRRILNYGSKINRRQRQLKG